MEGPRENPGVNTRSIQELFAIRDSRSKEYSCTITVSMLEVYNEQIRDLLTEKLAELDVKQNSTGTKRVSRNC
jgi:kinesin family protein C2/C3